MNEKQSGKGFVDNQLVGAAKVAKNLKYLVKGGRNCRIARATLNHGVFASTGANYLEEVCHYKFEVN